MKNQDGPEMRRQPGKIETEVWFLGFKVKENKVKITEGIGGRAKFSSKTLTAPEIWNQCLHVCLIIVAVGGGVWMSQHHRSR